MRLATTRQLLLCLALLGACGYAAATEAQQVVPDGSGNCTDDTPAVDIPLDDGSIDPLPAATHTQRSHKSKSASTHPAHSNASTRSTPPRWHSFLPGMFR